MTELYKIKNELDSPIRDSMLNRRTVTHNFNNLQEFQSKKKEKTVLYGLEMLTLFRVEAKRHPLPVFPL